MYSARSRAMFMVRGKLLIDESRYAGHAVYEWRLKPRYNPPSLDRSDKYTTREAACPLNKSSCRICAVAAKSMT